MLIVHVHVSVKPEYVEAFEKATIDNATCSIHEPGVVRFDLVQQADNPTRFIIVEIYRTAEDSAKHKETDHYKKWRDAVEPMMAEPRRSVKYKEVFPADEQGWVS